MSNPKSINRSVAPAVQLLQNYELTIATILRYEFNPYILTSKTLTNPILEFGAPNHNSLLSGFEDDFPDNMHLAYVCTVDNEECPPLETVFETQSTTLVSFFALQLVDIPLCFRNTNSLYSATAAMPKLRFINMLMRHGKRANISKSYALAVHSIFTTTGLNSLDAFGSPTWSHIYSTFNQSHFTGNSGTGRTMVPLQLSPLMELTDNSNLTFTKEDYQTPEDDWFQEFLLEELTQYLPVFSFYVNNVDNMNRKHSSGNTGKHSISWNYVPKYNRFITTLRWLTNDVRFQNSNTFNLRLLRSLENLMFDRSSHLVFQIRQFVHNFVYQNHKNTLLSTLNSSS